MFLFVPYVFIHLNGSIQYNLLRINKCFIYAKNIPVHVPCVITYLRYLYIIRVGLVLDRDKTGFFDNGTQINRIKIHVCFVLDFPSDPMLNSV